MHPLDAIATMAAHEHAGDTPAGAADYREALRTAEVLGEAEWRMWVARSMGVTMETVKTYEANPQTYDLRGPSALYRYFDHAGRLLYVGVAKDPIQRDREHANSSEWHRHFSRHTVEWHEVRDSALAAERAAIRDESPVFNRLASRAGPEAAAAYLAEAVSS